MTPPPRNFAELAAWRRDLHRAPELSGEEAATAREVARFLAGTGADRVVEGLGGHGVAFVYEGAAPGPTVAFRAELDALPIEEAAGPAHRSRVAGKAHLCGHDGHMAALAALGRAFGRRRPARGRATLLFQPAEETGAGAAAVIADPRFADIAPDWVFAWHNLPGLPLGFAALREGPVNCASRGLRIALAGRTSHASTPERALSPMRALAALMPALADLSRGDVADPDFALVTVTHATLGERAFGVAPGAAELWATLRALTDAGMSALVARAEALARGAATADGLGVSIEHSDVFDHCHNDPEAVAILARALDAQGVPRGEAGLPMRASEDFGRFGARAKTAMFFLGAGERHPGLHEPDYDFPDALAPIAAGAMERVARDLLG